MFQSNQNTPYSKSSNGDDFVLKEDHLGVYTTLPNTNDSSPPQHGNRGSDGHISGQLNKAIEGRQRAIAAGNQLKQDWLDAEHWRALAKIHADSKKNRANKSTRNGLIPLLSIFRFRVRVTRLVLK